MIWSVYTLAVLLPQVAMYVSVLLIATVYFAKALSINEVIYPSEHPIIAKAQNNLGSVYFALGDLKNAAILFEKALIVEIKLLGQDHPDVAERQNNLAWVFLKLDQREKAIELWEHAHTTLIKKLGKDHPTTKQIGSYITKFQSQKM